jgi:carbon-monoxide dehydrogenase small subunit
VKAPIEVKINGRIYRIDVDTRMNLADMLRDRLKLTGTHVGCGTGSCGACTVMLNGETVKSCCVLAADANGQEILTIEGLADDPAALHPIQEAFVQNHGLQCGYCTSGMVLSSLQLLNKNPDPSESEIRRAIAGNLCRCTGYQFIVKSIQQAAKTMHKGAVR